MTLTKAGVSGILAAKSFRAAQHSMQTACLRVLLTVLALLAGPAFPADSTYPFTVQTERSGDGFVVVSVPFQFHVGNPPVAFSPEFGILAKADYTSPGQVPGFGSSTQSAHSAPTVRGAASDSGRTSSPDGPSIYIEVPAPLRQFLLRISVWQWAGALLSIWVILLGLRAVRQSRRERAWTDLSSIDREPREPAFRSREAPDFVHHELSAKDRLIAACTSDRREADRLMAVQYEKSPTIDDEEAARRALAAMIAHRQRVR